MPVLTRLWLCPQPVRYQSGFAVAVFDWHLRIVHQILPRAKEARGAVECSKTERVATGPHLRYGWVWAEVYNTTKRFYCSTTFLAHHRTQTNTSPRHDARTICFVLQKSHSAWAEMWQCDAEKRCQGYYKDKVPNRNSMWIGERQSQGVWRRKDGGRSQEGEGGRGGEGTGQYSELLVGFRQLRFSIHVMPSSEVNKNPSSTCWKEKYQEKLVNMCKIDQRKSKRNQVC